MAGEAIDYTNIPDELNPAKIAESNQNTIRQSVEQDLVFNKPTDLDDTRAAFDKLREERKKQAEEKPTVTVTPKTEETPPAETPPSTETPPVETPAETPPAAPAATPNIFDDVQLSPKASPKSAEAFATIKLRASQEIAARDKAIDELKAEVAALKESTTAGPPKELTDELTQLREFRTRLDIEADPKWNEYNKTIENTRAFIFAQLKKHPKVSAATIAEIEKFGGPDKVNLNDLWEHIQDPSFQRLVEAKLADIEHTEFNRNQALEKAKANVAEYVSERQKAFQQNATAHNAATKAELKGLTDTFKWYNLKTVPAGATEAQRKEIETHNAVIKDIQTQVQEALNDDSPQMRAILLGATVNLLYKQYLDPLKDAKIAAIEKELTETKAQLARIKGASVNRLAQSSASTGGTPPPKAVSDAERISLTTADALGALKQSIAASRNG